MVAVRGRTAFREYMAQLATDIDEKLLPGAARAGAKVIADEARRLCESSTVAEAIKVKVRNDGGRISATIGVDKGWPMHLGIWLEYGTDPHTITARGNTLSIGGRPVGKSVLHPGARPFPFLRPALDTRDKDAFAAAQAFINSRVSRSGIAGGSKGDQE